MSMVAWLRCGGGPRLKRRRESAASAARARARSAALGERGPHRFSGSMRHCGAANEAKVEPQIGDAREAPRCEQPAGRARRDARASSPEPAPPSHRAAPDMSWRGRRRRRARGGRRGRPWIRAGMRGAWSRPRGPAEVGPWRGRHQRRRRRRRRGERPWSAAAPTPRPHSAAAGAAAPAARAPSPCRGRRWWPGRALGAPPAARARPGRAGARRALRMAGAWRAVGANARDGRWFRGWAAGAPPANAPPSSPPPSLHPGRSRPAVRAARVCVRRECAGRRRRRAKPLARRRRRRPSPASPAARAPRARRAAAAVKSQGA